MSLLKIVLMLTTMIYACFSDSIHENTNDLFTLNVTLKDYQSTKEDQIVFVQYRLPDEELIIVGYIPLVTMVTAHHMNMVACENPASNDTYWNDGIQGCGTGARMLLYGWDRDALPFRLLDDIGIVIGKNTPYKYLVVNIHFVPMVKNDYSGSQLLLSRKRRKYLAGVMSGGAEMFSLPPTTLNIKTPFSCQYRGPKLTMFAVGVHAHRWARVNSLYRVRNNTVIEIVKVDPQQIHQSYRLSSPIEIESDDFIIGQCVFDNIDNRTIKVGLSHNDEMCNVMAGYWYERIVSENSNGKVPFEACWGDFFPHISALIPRDSEIAPVKAYRISTTDPYTLKIILILFMTVICFSIFIVGCIFYLRKSYIVFDKKTQLNRSWMMDDWCIRRNGFDRLQQQLDDENEL